jgi:hypothetical protein
MSHVDISLRVRWREAHVDSVLQYYVFCACVLNRIYDVLCVCISDDASFCDVRTFERLGLGVSNSKMRVTGIHVEFLPSSLFGKRSCRCGRP